MEAVRRRKGTPAPVQGSLRLGRKVDLHVPKTLHPFLRDKVLGQAEAVYDGA
jgi:hypothetical protein